MSDLDTIFAHLNSALRAQNMEKLTSKSSQNIYMRHINDLKTTAELKRVYTDQRDLLQRQKKGLLGLGEEILDLPTALKKLRECNMKLIETQEKLEAATGNHTQHIEQLRSMTRDLLKKDLGSGIGIEPGSANLAPSKLQLHKMKLEVRKRAKEEESELLAPSAQTKKLLSNAKESAEEIANVNDVDYAKILTTTASERRKEEADDEQGDDDIGTIDLSSLEFI